MSIWGDLNVYTALSEDGVRKQFDCHWKLWISPGGWQPSGKHVPPTDLAFRYDAVALGVTNPFLATAIIISWGTSSLKIR